MINNGYSITIEDEKELRNFKKSSAYGAYLKSIAASPAFTSMMNEHINDVNIAEDIKQLVINGKSPDDKTANALNDIFKRSISRMAISIVADTFILKELEEIKVDEVISDIKEDFAVTYLLGLADKKHYEQAAKLVKEGKLEEDSIGVRGLLAYSKNAGINRANARKELLMSPKKLDTPSVTKTVTRKTGFVDIDSNHIEL